MFENVSAHAKKYFEKMFNFVYILKVWGSKTCLFKIKIYFTQHDRQKISNYYFFVFLKDNFLNFVNKVVLVTKNKAIHQKLNQHLLLKKKLNF